MLIVVDHMKHEEFMNLVSYLASNSLKFTVAESLQSICGCSNKPSGSNCNMVVAKERIEDYESTVDGSAVEETEMKPPTAEGSAQIQGEKDVPQRIMDLLNAVKAENDVIDDEPVIYLSDDSPHSNDQSPGPSTSQSGHNQAHFTHASTDRMTCSQHEQEDLERHGIQRISTSNQQKCSGKRVRDGRECKECQVCGKKLAVHDREKRMNHAQVHLNIKRYRCSLCPNESRQQTNVFSHIRTVHRADPSGTCIDQLTPTEANELYEYSLRCFPLETFKHRRNHISTFPPF